ncbi:MAG: acyl-CoA thioesterase [Parachlamydia sp.]|nr:acyl-CoA thioesterase [Parachlamydia sp.]
MIFEAKNKVRIHDTDMAGILYFPRIFRFVHDALEDLMKSEGFPFEKMLRSDFVFVIVHSEADYYNSLVVGDEIQIHAHVDRIGTTSFTMIYEFYKTDQTHMGRARTVHVTVDNASRKKIPVPEIMRKILEKFLA